MRFGWILCASGVFFHLLSAEGKRSLVLQLDQAAKLHEARDRAGAIQLLQKQYRELQSEALGRTTNSSSESFAESAAAAKQAQQNSGRNLESKRPRRPHEIQKVDARLEKLNEALLGAIDQIGTDFYFEATQQLYEQALNLSASDPNSALGKIQEAKKREKDNLSLGLAEVRILMAKGDCSLAWKKLTEEWGPLYSLSSLYRLALHQSELCAGLELTWSSLGLPVSLHSKALEAGIALKMQNRVRLLQLSTELEKMDRDYPETYYFKLQGLRESKPAEAKQAAEKYKQLCQSLSALKQRSYLMDPFLCRRTAEVDQYFGSTHTPQS